MSYDVLPFSLHWTTTDQRHRYNSAEAFHHPTLQTIALAPLSILMKLAVNCAPRKEGQWMIFLQPKQLLCNISEEQFTKVVTVGERCCMFAWTCQLLKTGDGLIQTTGNHYGPPYLRPVYHPESYSAVAVRKAAL